MRCVRRWRLALLCLSPVISFTGLLTICAAGPQIQKKFPAYPLNLFAQASKDDYIGDAECVACHEPYVSSFENSPHASYSRNPRLPIDRKGCESCHGPGGPHLANLENEADIPRYIIGYTNRNPRQTSEACMRCHQDTLSDSHWRRTAHARADIGCVDCHQIHFGGQHGLPKPGPVDTAIGAGRPIAEPASETKKQPPQPAASRVPARESIFIAQPENRKLLRGDEATMCGRCHRKATLEFRHNFHHPVPEGRLLCSDCHDVHPSKGMHRKVRPGKDMCVTCHAEMQGPFVFEHDLQVGTDDGGCDECHRPHGSNNPALLTTFSRGACGKCHTDKMATHFPGRTCWQSGCHVAIHGSNTDPLFLRR